MSTSSHPRRLRRRDRAASAALLVLGLLVGGCTPAEPERTRVYPVQGKLLVNGRPAAHAEVTLHRQPPLTDPGGRPLFPYAVVQADGAFQVETYADHDGAPVGEYVVTVTWPKVTIEGGEEVLGPDQLRGRFSKPTRPAAKVVVEARENHLPPIQLH